ncbi:nucleotidyltransferase family protein [Erythrobacter sp. YJ-T3-07]|uniref:nucleotidyltransferase family protein n=1 Tax=Erythrobacter sp. YJ-T3-07 TaxID=2793063 RepID=UPI0018D3EC13|nr:nucleotidyltransferase family protein [Erythrobacter sp. YJ-T3-07]MBH1944940.1 nucleotidyltransferase family protein [Erythrobacter sp. YJ-T3-07]
MIAIDPSVACILLAAGSARRFGGGKLFAPLNGLPLWQWAASRLEQAGFVSRYLVVNPGDQAQPTRSGWDRVENTSAEEGIASSIRTGVESASGRSRMVIALADMPFVDPGHLAALARSDGVVFTRFADGRPGCPAAFPAGALASLLQLRGDRGAAALCSTLGGTTKAPLDGGLTTFDVDRDADLSEAERMIRRNPRLSFLR